MKREEEEGVLKMQIDNLRGQLEQLRRARPGLEEKLKKLQREKDDLLLQEKMDFEREMKEEKSNI